MTTDVNTYALDHILKEHLVAEVKLHMEKLISEEMEEIARNAVQRFLDFEIAKDTNAMNMKDSYYFNFVQKITNTIVKPVVIQEKKELK